MIRILFLPSSTKQCSALVLNKNKNFQPSSKRDSSFAFTIDTLQKALRRLSYAAYYLMQLTIKVNLPCLWSENQLLQSCLQEENPRILQNKQLCYMTCLFPWSLLGCSNCRQQQSFHEAAPQLQGLSLVPPLWRLQHQPHIQLWASSVWACSWLCCPPLRCCIASAMSQVRYVSDSILYACKVQQKDGARWQTLLERPRLSC